MPYIKHSAAPIVGMAAAAVGVALWYGFIGLMSFLGETVTELALSLGGDPAIWVGGGSHQAELSLAAVGTGFLVSVAVLLVSLYVLGDVILGWFLRAKDRSRAAVQTQQRENLSPATDERESLTAERDRLLTRVVEINRLLGE